MKLYIKYNPIINDFEMDFDITELCHEIKSVSQKIFKSIDSHIKKRFTICVIDKRYIDTGYIIEYGTIYLSKSDFKNLDFNRLYTIQGDILPDIFDPNILIDYSGELNGYEDDTPELKDFNFCLYVD